MTALPRPRLCIAGLAAALLAGCGAHTSGSTGSSGAAAAAGGPRPAGAAAVVTEAAQLGGSRTVAVTVTLTGPATYEGGCVPTLRIALADGAGTTVDGSGTAQGLHCDAIAVLHLDAGSRQSFAVEVAVPHPGAWAVSGTLRGVGAIPAVSVTVGG